MALNIIRAGILSTVQDLGRWGFQRFGVPVGGAMDEFSHRLANLLVGNDEADAAIEITLVGPAFTLTADTLLAVCGGDFEPRVNEERLPRARPVLVKAGAKIDFGRCKRGCRAYLAVSGGFQVEPVMGSRSTFLRGGFGGYHGRALKRGDVLETGETDVTLYPGLRKRLEASHAASAHPGWAATERVELLAPGPYVIRFTRGKHWDCFEEEALAQFQVGEYRVGTNSDRQGYRLVGSPMLLKAPLDLISEGVTFGTIQVPPDGEPIVLMASRQTTGGYPRLGEVISADLPLLAQLPPGAQMKFQQVTLEQAHALLLEREKDLVRMRQAVQLQARQ